MLASQSFIGDAIPESGRRNPSPSFERPRERRRVRIPKTMCSLPDCRAAVQKLSRHPLAKVVEDLVERHSLGLQTAQQSMPADSQSLSNLADTRLTDRQCRREEILDPPSK